MFRFKISLLIAFTLLLNLILPAALAAAETAESAPVKMVDLNYTKDVFVSLGEEYSSNKYLNSSGPWVALNEGGFITNSNIKFEGGILTFNNLPYKIGPLGSTGKPNESANAIRAQDSSSTIVINIEDGFYSKVSFLANSAVSSSTDHDAATVTVTYRGEATPVTTGITRIASYRTENSADPAISGEAYIGQLGGIKSDAKSDISYKGHLYAYTIDTDKEKIVDRITIAGERAVVFAVTTVGLTLSELKDGLGEIIDRLPEIELMTGEDKDMVIWLRETINKLKIEQGFSEKTISPQLLLKLKELEKSIIIPPAYKAELSYTRDVFVGTNETIDSPKLCVQSNQDVGMVEDVLKALPDFNNNTLTFKGIEYRFGPLGALGQPSALYNAVHGADGKPVSIDLDDRFYSSIRFIANNSSTSDKTFNATITYIDGSADVISIKLSSFSSLNSAVPENAKYEEYFVAETKALRAGGSYRGYYYAYYLTPDKNKLVDKISLDSNQAVVYALTGLGITASEAVPNIEALIGNLDVSTASENQVRIIRNEIKSAKALGMKESEISNIGEFREIELSVCPVLEFDWTEYTVYNTKGEAISDLSQAAGEKVFVSATLENNYRLTGQSYSVIMAVYSNENKLEDIYVNSGAISIGDSEEIFELIAISDKATSDWEIKCFVFNSIDNIKPLFDNR